MTSSSRVLEFIICPQCGGDLRLTKEQFLVCLKCRLCFPMENGMPDLSISAASSFSKSGEIIPRKSIASFIVESGPADAGIEFQLEPHSCKAIGRKLEDGIQTQVFNIDMTLTLDDHTKQIIKNYFTKTSKKKLKPVSDKSEDISSFHRVPDLILNDPGVSRLHAMLFYDSGDAGVLDLVSRNGTFVNSKEIEAVLLKSGDQIQVGNTMIRVKIQ